MKDSVMISMWSLYAKGAEIIWYHPDQYVMSIPDICFQEGGSRDLCIKAGIIAEGSVNGVMDGKMYNRAVHVHKIIYESFMRLAWIEFIPWLEKTRQEKNLSNMH